MKPSIYSLRLEDLQSWVEQQGEKPFRATQILNGYIKTGDVI